jgi:hypothetical protein
MHDLAAFEPFIASDDGTTLQLRRPWTLSDAAVRAMLYLLIGLAAGLPLLILFALSTKPITLGRALFALAALPLLWLVIKLMLRTLLFDGVRVIRASAEGLYLEGSAGFLRKRRLTLAPDATRAIIARRRTAKPRSTLPRTWWLELSVRTEDQQHPMGFFKVRDEHDHRADAAAAHLAARLGAALELSGASAPVRN